MRRCERLLKQGPLCIQETKWSGSQSETISQHIPGIQIAETHAIRSRQGKWSGGTAILIPTGFRLKNWQVLVDGKAVIALVADRGSSFYLLSVYLHPEQVRQDLLSILSAWERYEKIEAGILVAGDFNRADEKYPELWRRWLDTFQVFDVHPTLRTYRHPGGTSNLDRCLVPEEWVSSARWKQGLFGTKMNALFPNKQILKDPFFKISPSSLSSVRTQTRKKN